ncbi:MAG: conserved repeat domain protein, partial [Ilumatobacteraceae bacterium]|nr:conserved repeat domain protein [Ilumatobacteraceae bacterium]
GSLPFQPTVFGLIALWMPWFVLTSIGLWVLSDGAMRPGDRLRSSMRLLGASWRGVMAPNGRPENPQYAVAGAFGVHHGVASAVSVAAISVVVGLRGVSDRLTHTLQPLPVNQTAGLLAVALWSLGGGLDALRLLARRAQTRRASRVASSLPSTFADRAALVVDLTPHGAGVISEVELAVGRHDRLDVVVPTASGVVTATVPVTVRNVRADFSGELRYGVEFGAMPTYVADALVEFCVVQPAIEMLGGTTVQSGATEVRPVVLLDDRALLPRRIGLRLAALVAVAGAMASAVPASASASGTSSARLSGQIVVAGEASADVSSGDAPLPPSAGDPDDPVTPGQAATTTADGPATWNTLDMVTVDSISAVAEPAVPGGHGPAGALVTVLCATDDGPDDLWGTSDDAYTGPVSAIVNGDGTYDVASTGDACWISVAPPAGYMVPGETSDLESASTPQVLDLSTTTIAPIKIVPTTGSRASYGPAHVDDVVWGDLDSDGVLDADEPFLAGVTVTLFADDGTVQGIGTTSATGRYSFEGLPVGRYRIGVSNLPSGMVASGVLGMTAPFVVSADVTPNLAIGLRPAPPIVADDQTSDSTGGAKSAADEHRLLPKPAGDQLARSADDGSAAAALIVIMLAALMGVSVVAGSVRPGRAPGRGSVIRRPQTSQ